METYPVNDCDPNNEPELAEEAERVGDDVPEQTVGCLPGYTVPTLQTGNNRVFNVMVPLQTQSDQE